MDVRSTPPCRTTMNFREYINFTELVDERRLGSVFRQARAWRRVWRRLCQLDPRPLSVAQCCVLLSSAKPSTGIRRSIGSFLRRYKLHSTGTVCFPKFYLSWVSSLVTADVRGLRCCKVRAQFLIPALFVPYYCEGAMYVDHCQIVRRRY